MAYSLQSLITILQQILNPQQTHLFVTDNKPQLESLLQKAVDLSQILEDSSVPELESLGSQIRDAIYKAEDIIECHMLDQVDWWRKNTGLSFPAPDLKQVIEEFDSAIEQAVEIVEGKAKMSTGSSSSGAAVLPGHPSSNTVLVGIDDAREQLKDRLTGKESKLQIVPIVGMGGIGKTTLAQLLYNDELIQFHFDVLAWTTISQDYNERKFLLDLLRRPKEKLSGELTECTDNKLKDILYRRLCGRRYLVVLDDMWSTHSWDAIRSCFPDNNNGSRIILTTRKSNVAICVGTHSLLHHVRLMDLSHIWYLLHQIVFGEERCPYALREIGRKIASDCRGLPLAINVIGGLLSKAERSKDVWEKIANDVSKAIAETDNEFSSLLSLSYDHLPNQLKPCFQYMGAFPENYEIKGSKLISMWVAEGFVKSNGDKSLEEEAEDYLESLVESNLVLVTRKKSNGKSMCYGMHGLLRYFLYTRRGDEEKSVHVKNERVEVALHKVRRVSVHTASNEMEEDIYAMPLARSFICFGRDMSPEIVSSVFLVLRLLRVLDVLDMQFQEFPIEVLKLVNLRYLAFSCSSKSDIPKEISRLLNLQTLIAEIMWGNVATEIWEMSELRHLKLRAELNIKDECMKQKMQENLQTVSWVTFDSSLIRKGLFKTIPNIKNLGIHFSEIDDVVDLQHVHKLQKLRCEFDVDEGAMRYLLAIRFPSCLRKLTLYGCLIFRRDVMRTLHTLPNLEVLKLSNCVFENEVFEAAEDDVIQSLQSLHLEELNNLVRWRADDTNFPRLGELVIRECPVLEEIPSGIGEIPTLQRIQLCKCNPSLEASARKIQIKYDLQVEIISH